MNNNTDKKRNGTPVLVDLEKLKSVVEKLDDENEKAFNSLKSQLELTTSQYNQVVKKNGELQKSLINLHKGLCVIKEKLQFISHSLPMLSPEQKAFSELIDYIKDLQDEN